MKFYIRNMVNHRCEMVVMEELQKIGVLKEQVKIDVGIVILQHNLSQKQQKCLKENLLKCGLEIIEHRKDILVESIVHVITRMIHSDELPPSNYADFISQKLNLDYTYLANVFSKTRNETIQQFIIRLKIERVKELLLYDEFTLTAISNKLHYSSVAHLSNQFKKVTGYSPSSFLKQETKRVADLENMGYM